MTISHAEFDEAGANLITIGGNPENVTIAVWRIKDLKEAVKKIKFGATVKTINPYIVCELGKLNVHTLAIDQFHSD